MNGRGRRPPPRKSSIVFLGSFFPRGFLPGFLFGRFFLDHFLFRRFFAGHPFAAGTAGGPFLKQAQGQLDDAKARGELAQKELDRATTLIKTQAIRLTDLPEAAQRKLNQRKGMRSRLHGALDLIGRDDSIL